MSAIKILKLKILKDDKHGKFKKRKCWECGRSISAKTGSRSILMKMKVYEKKILFLSST